VAGGRVLNETKLDVRLLDRRLFIVVFIFTLVSAIVGMRNYLVFLLHFQVGGVDIAAISLFFVVVGFIIDPLLFFIIVYRYCGGPLLNRMARVLISIILGSLLGIWIGNLVVAGLVTVLSSAEEASANAFFLSSLNYLPIQVISHLFEAIAALAFSDLVPKWRSTLPASEFQRRTPGGIVFLAVVYVVFAFLNVLLVPVLALSGLKINSINSIMTLAVVGILTIGQFFLAFGLYTGKKWAWILAVVSTGSTFLIDVTSLGTLLALEFQGAETPSWLLIGLLFSFLISLAIFVYMLSLSVRKFFRLLNSIEDIE
jgi:hypothetical protein